MHDEVSVFHVNEVDGQSIAARPAAPANPTAMPHEDKPAAAKPSRMKPAPAAGVKPASAKPAAAAPKRGGLVGRMQASLATAVAVADPQWQEF
jgi:hypothetical protein